MRPIVLLLCLFFALPAPAQVKRMRLQNLQTGEERVLEVGDKVLLALDARYCKKNPHKMTVNVYNYDEPRLGKIFYAKERILRITDSSMIFTNGTYAVFDGLLGIKKITFGNTVLRTLAAGGGVFLMVAGGLTCLGGIYNGDVRTVVIGAGLSVGGYYLTTSPKRYLSDNELISWVITVE